jgi:serine/threonine protein kinase
MFTGHSDPTSSLCLANLGVFCYCDGCESRRPDPTSTTTANFKIVPNNHTPIYAGNKPYSLTARHPTQFNTGTSHGWRNTDYSSSSLSVSLPETVHHSGYTFPEISERPILGGLAITPTQNVFLETDRFGDILEQSKAQFASAPGPPIYQNSFYPSISSHSTSSWNPNSVPSTGQANWNEALSEPIRSMGYHPSGRFSPTQSFNTTDHSYRHVPRKRSYRRNLIPSVSYPEGPQSVPVPMTPACQQFLEAQEYLDVRLRNASKLTDSWKKDFAKLLKISTIQLGVFIEARNVIRPKLEDLASATENLGIPAEHIAAWFLQVHPGKPPRDVMNDSAYHSNVNSSQEPTRPAKRQKKTPADKSPLKPYQCTFIGRGKSYCLQTSKDYADWKRHEETHYPQKRWVCLIQGSNEDRSCHECSGGIDLVGQPVTITHTTCLKRPPRQGHFFPRRDKLLDHVRSKHLCEASIGTWHQNVSGDWKRQRGFCGEMFSEWESRCRHVGPHFEKGDRMIPDWKDPWPAVLEISDQRPDDDNENNNDNDMDNNNFNLGRRADKGSTAPKDNSKGDGRGDDQQRDDRNEPRNSSNCHGGRRGSSNRKVQSEQSDQQERNLHITIPGQSNSINERSQYSKQLPSSQDISLPFRSVRKLGYGAFGTVDEIVHPPSNTRFARKRIRTSRRDPSRALAQVRKEITCLRQLNHEHIIKVMASYGVKDQISIIMSPIADCNLWEFMRSPALQAAAQRSLLSKWFGCLASALSYVHRKSWLHMDLKPQNILISGDRVLLSDFGSAYSVANHGMGEMAGMRYAITPMYCAPELIGRGVSEAATWASDIYSLGCIFLEMATGILRQSVSRFEDLRSFGSGDKSYNRNARKCMFWIDSLRGICEDISPRVRDEDFQVIKSMLSFDMIKRPTAQSLEEFYSKDYYCDRGNHRTDDYYFTKLTDKPFFDLMVVASTWLRTCDTYHEHCSHRVEDFFPTRILNVGAEGDTIRLQSSLHELASPYVALSHCWGADNVLKTTSQTLNERLLGIQSSSLSNTFQNAVRITRALGFNYLWIDSLCIVQDSPEDWAKVSSQMHKIFSNSYLTISILNEEESPTTFSRGPAIRKLTGGHYCKHECRAFQPLLEDTASTMTLDSPISMRAWTLQERVLSRRVLHFSSTRLAWECGSGTSISDSISIMRNSIGTGERILSSNDFESKDLCLAALQAPPTPQVRKLWRDIVREYSKRQLTRPFDKLPALAGLAATISVFGGGEYLAGLWIDDLKHSLLWSRDFSVPPAVRPTYRAPSWSWAAIDSKVVWSKSVTDLPDDCKTTILSCSTTLSSKYSPFGAVLDGYLEISGPMQKVVVIHPYVEQLLEVVSSKPFAFAQWDALTVSAETRRVQREKGYQIEDLWCLQILHGAGLVLKERSDCEGRFERAGVYWTRVDTDSAKAGDGCWEHRTITIL